MNEYPTSEELQKIKEWPVDDFTGLCEYIYDIYNSNFGNCELEYNLDKVEVVSLVLITGGWSGNEDIIDAIWANRVWYLRYWESTHRGGKYVFSKDN